MSTLRNLLRQHLDIAGSKNQTGDLAPLTDESARLGQVVVGTSGSGASVIAGPVVVVTGLAGMDDTDLGKFLEISGAANSDNNGAFRITSIISASTVEISNSLASTDLNNGSLVWQGRTPYTLEDDLNYTRSDRQAIKGVGYDQPVPTYVRATDTGTLLPASLYNIAGKTTDAKALIYWTRSEPLSVVTSDTYVLLSEPGELPYANSVNRTGVPIYDGYDAGNEDATCAVLVDDVSNAALRVLTGVDTGKLIYGRTRQGVSGTDGYSVEIEFRAVDDGYDLSTSVAYTWEASQTNSIGALYPYRERLDQLPEHAFKPIVSSGGGSGTGDVTGAANVGTGADIFRDKTGSTLNFRGVEGVNDISTAVSGDNVEVDGYNLLPRDGSRPMTGDLDLDGYTITNVGEPVDDTDAATKIYVENYVDGYTFKLDIPGAQFGSVLYFNGTDWVGLNPETDGYVLTTHDIGAAPTWEVGGSGGIPAPHATSHLPDNSDGLLIGTPVQIGDVNDDGYANSFVRSDHVHKLGGTVGGDLSGTLPNPTVANLTIAGQQQGSVLYFNGVSWVYLAPATDGYVLTTHDVFDNPTWEEPPGAQGGVTPTQHAALRQLIHLADGVGGPFEEFTSGAYREILPASSPFPTQVIWWDSVAKNKKIVEKVLTRNAQKLPITTQWKAYNSGGAVEATVTDTITYSGVFEIDRTRTVS